MEVRVEEAGGGDDGGQDEVAGEDFLRVSATGYLFLERIERKCSARRAQGARRVAVPA